MPLVLASEFFTRLSGLFRIPAALDTEFCLDAILRGRLQARIMYVCHELTNFPSLEIGLVFN